jgi:hypothetical protein
MPMLGLRLSLLLSCGLPLCMALRKVAGHEKPPTHG